VKAIEGLPRRYTPGVTTTDARSVSTTLASADYERVQRLAERHGLTVDAYVRRAIADEVRFDEVASAGGEVIIRECDGTQERVRYRR